MINLTSWIKTPLQRLILGSALFFAVLLLFQYGKGQMIASFMAAQAQLPVAVKTMTLAKRPYQATYRTVGLIESVLGADLSLEAMGIVDRLCVEPGARVAQGDILMVLDTKQEEAQCQVLESEAHLAELEYQRAKMQFEQKAVSRSTLDSAEAQWRSSLAALQAQSAILERKFLRAPFAGRISLFAVTPGMYLSMGMPITRIDSFDKMRLRFYVPAQKAHRIKKGQSFRILSYTGRIETIASAVNPVTGMLAVEGLLSSEPTYSFVSGVKEEVIVALGAPQQRLMIPKTAIQFNTYGNIVFVVRPQGTEQVVEAVFVKVSDQDGEWVLVDQGLEEGDQIVIEGQMNLSAGTKVTLS